MPRAAGQQPHCVGASSSASHRFSQEDRGLNHTLGGEARLTVCTETASFSMKGDRL